MFDPYREADEVVGDRASRAFDGLTVLRKAFDAAKRGRGDDHFEPCADPARLLGTTLHEQGQHAAKAVGHLSPGDVVPGMACEPGIEDALDLGMALKVPGDS